jgi:hypothetical protein
MSDMIRRMHQFAKKAMATFPTGQDKLSNPDFPGELPSPQSDQPITNGGNAMGKARYHPLTMYQAEDTTVDTGKKIKR